MFALEVELEFDDGAALYLNGEEIAREHLRPVYAGADELAELAVDGQLQGRTVRYRLPTDLLVAGDNVLAAELHQVAVDDSDLRFDLQLRLLRTARPQLELLPGINQLTVEYVDSAGNVLESESLDLFFDPGSTNDLAGVVAGPLVLDAASGPHRVTGATTVTGGLVVEPGATVFFEDGAVLTVDGAALLALGERDRRIWLGPNPGSATDTPQVVANAGLTLAHCDYHGSTSAGGSAGFTAGGLLAVRGGYFVGRGEDLFAIDNAPVLFRSNELAAMFGEPAVGAVGGREYLNAFNGTEGFFVVESNVFHPTASGSDMIRINGVVAGDPPAEIRNNTFLGTQDEVFETEGDGVFEGNLVVGVEDPDAGASDDASVIRAAGSNQIFAITRNVIVDSQHVAELIDGAFAYVENNTVSNVVADPTSEDAPLMLLNATALPGTGVLLADNVWDQLQNDVIGRPDESTTSVIQVQGDLVSSAAAFANVSGTHSVSFLEGVPVFADAPGLDFSLAAGSPGVAAGLLGGDLGAGAPAGIQVSGVPDVSTSTTVELTVGGPGRVRLRLPA